MGIFSIIKRAFGFEGDDEDDELQPPTDNSDDTETTDSPAAASTADESKAVTTTITEARMAATEQSVQPADLPAGADPKLPADLFDGAIAVFNASLPSFVARSIDPAREREALIEQLDATLRKRLDEEFDRARRQGLGAGSGNQEQLEKQLAEAMAARRAAEEHLREANAARLSAERQKRALAERNHDLEQQAAKFESSHEQLTLEVRTLQNRLRVAEVNGQLAGDPEAAAAAAAALADNAKLREALEQQRAQKQIADAMINSLQTAAAEASQHAEQLEARLKTHDLELPTREEIQAIEEQIKEFEQVKQRKNEKIAALKAERDALKAELDAATAERDAARTELDAAKAERDVLEARTGELNETIRANLYTHSLEQARMSQRIEKLERELAEASATAAKTAAVAAVEPQPVSAPDAASEPAPEPEPVAAIAAAEPVPEPYPVEEMEVKSLSFIDDNQPAKPARRRKRSKPAPHINAIDEYMEGNDWFGTPESPTDPGSDKTKTESKPASDDFGYKTPPRRDTAVNEDQLSLW